MFRQTITQTPFSCDEADEVLKNISAPAAQDVTFVSTLRALLGKRVSEDESVEFVEQRLYGSCTTTVAFDYMPQRADLIELFENNTVDLEAAEKLMEKTYPSWEKLPKITEFYRKQFPVLCYIERELKSVFLIAPRLLAAQEFRYLQCSIPAFLPWYFEGENALKETDMKLIESLTKRTAESYLDCLSEMAKEYDFETNFVKRLLGGFETQADRVMCEQSEKKIQSLINDINDLNRRIGGLLRQKSEEEIRLFGLRTKIENGSEGSQLEDYFLSNKSLSLVSAKNREITFVCASEVEYYDTEMVESVLENQTSYIYQTRGRRSFVSPSDMAMLIREIFVTQKLKLRMCAAYRIELNGRACGLTNYNYEYRGENCLPNPHIDTYACLGNYQRTINECIMQNDYISAAEQCVASCKSLNFGDYTVMDTFMDKMYRNAVRCVVLPNGECVTPSNAVVWLKAEGENEDE